MNVCIYPSYRLRITAYVLCTWSILLSLYWYCAHTTDRHAILKIQPQNDVPVADLTPRTSVYRKALNQNTSKDKCEVKQAVTAIRPLLKALERNSRKQLSLEKSRLSIVGKHGFITLQGNNAIFTVGDVLKIRIDLYSNDGEKRTHGGDIIKVRISEDALNASAAGHVVDHGNGSYTAAVNCLWSGTPTVRVYFIRSGETMKTLKSFMTKVPSVWSIYAVYTNGEERECHPFRKWLIRPTRVCNMTERNGGMSWYCKAPTSNTTSCEDLKQFRHSKSDVPTVLHRILHPSQGELNPSFNITIKGKKLNNVAQPSKVPCSVYNRTNLWSLQSPVGYFFRNKWTVLHCTPPKPLPFRRCLQNKHLVLYGDSTVRQWFVDLKERFGCELNGESWTVPKWTRNSMAYCPSNNLTIDLIFHSLPGNFDDNKVNFNSISKHMLKFYSHEETIFLIGIQKHLHPYHPNVYRDRLKHIRGSVDVILKGAPNARIFVKGGHASWSMFNYEMDYGRILGEHFHDIRDKIVYLDHMDMTLARSITVTHPPADFVTEMVEQMLAYIC